MTEGLDRLLDLLDLEPIELNVFRGRNPGDWPGGRVFGGQVAAQALRAAGNTVDVDHRVHSLHGYFLRPGEPGVPILFQVDRIRNGRSFTTRRVVAVQRGEAIFSMSASFHKQEPGPEYQLPIAASAADPDGVDLPTGEFPARFRARRPFDMRELGPTPPDERGVFASTRRVWVRAEGRLPDEPALHACVLTYVSDMGVVTAARVPTASQGFERMMGASLDHAVWFHRPVRADDWLFFDLHAVSNSNARGLARGTMHSRDGVLGVSVAQEALIRPTGPLPQSARGR